jgi:MSHA pilin protein MshC
MNKSYHQQRINGFTLIELTMTIVLVGILSASMMPKLFSYAVFQQRTLFDDTLNAVRYAEKLAVASSCNVMVSISANQFSLLRPTMSDRSKCTSTTSTDFSLAVSRPGTNQGNYQGSVSGISLSSTSQYIFFLAKGNASTAATITVGSQLIDVVMDTGFVYAP